MIGESREGELERIPVERIRLPRVRVRHDAGAEEIQRLAASIRKHGLLQPLLVRPRPGGYEVVCGVRRFVACRALGLKSVPALVRTIDDRQAFELSLAENARREALSVAERQEILGRLVALYPARPREELETWLGPMGAEPAAERPAPAPAVVTAPAAAAAAPPVEEPPPAAEPLPAPARAAPPRETLPELIDRLAETAEILKEAGVSAPPGPPPVPVPAAGKKEPEEPEEEEEEEEAAPEEAGQPVPTGSTRVRKALMPRVQRLLKRFAEGGEVDLELLHVIVEDLSTLYERLDPADFLDLRYRERPSQYLARHCLNVAKLALYLAHHLGLSREGTDEVVTCALLHDVGMTRVKDEVFARRTQLDAAAWKLVRGHPVEGALLLTKEAVLRDVVARVALERHEPEDGGAAGKRGDEIHLYARLINVVDTYEAIISPRSHRLPLLPFQAMQLVLDGGAKGMLEWEVVQALVDALSIYPIGSYLRVEGGDIARVVRANRGKPEKPVLQVVADARGSVLARPIEIDLSVSDPAPKVEPIGSPI
jgi:putative nucleotidyltransferase with HDIG domain